MVETVLRLLADSFLFGKNAREVLGGSPDEAPTDYPRLVVGLTVPGFAADQPALSHLAAKYETTGRLTAPHGTLLNTLDPIIPAWQEQVYRAKVDAVGASGLLVAQIGVARFGHCNFPRQEVVGAFGTLVEAVRGEPLRQCRFPAGDKARQRRWCRS